MFESLKMLDFFFFVLFYKKLKLLIYKELFSTKRKHTAPFLLICDIQANLEMWHGESGVCHSSTFLKEILSSYFVNKCSPVDNFDQN